MLYSAHHYVGRDARGDKYSTCRCLVPLILLVVYGSIGPVMILHVIFLNQILFNIGIKRRRMLAWQGKWNTQRGVS